MAPFLLTIFKKLVTLTNKNLLCIYPARPDYVVYSLKFQKKKLPDELLIEILVQLPVKSLLRLNLCLQTMAFSHKPQFRQQKPESFNIGFGFDHTTNEYKVVVICQWADFDTGEDQHWHLRVYNHASDTWRTVYSLNTFDDPHPAFEGLDPSFPLLISDPPVSHCLRNDVFHWACCKSNNCYNILTFDMTSEALHLMKGPPLPTNFPLYWSVWELKDTIAGISSHYLDYPSSEDVGVWMMMEYGVENSWAKMFKFREVNGWSPVGIPYDDRVFFDDQNGQLVSLGMDDDYCVKKHRVYGMRGSTSHGICGSLGILKYVETLTTLKPV